MRFWRLEVPFSMPALIWNMMMSMSGGWFFVVASEAISVGNTTVTLRVSAPTSPSPSSRRTSPPSAGRLPRCSWSF